MSKMVGFGHFLLGCSILTTVGLYFINDTGKCCTVDQEVINSVYRIEKIHLQNNRDMQGIIKVQKHIAGVVNRSMKLVSKGVDSTVSIKDYKIMNTKPFACVGKVFGGIQQDMHNCVRETQKLENDLAAIQKRVDSQAKAVNDLQQLSAKNQKIEQPKTEKLVLLGIWTLTGIVFVLGGLSMFICNCFRNKKDKEG